MRGPGLSSAVLCAQYVPKSKIVSRLGIESVLAQRFAGPALGELSNCSRLLSQGPLTVGSMPPLPRITGRELVRALGKQGWVVVVQKGSHAQLKHPAAAAG